MTHGVLFEDMACDPGYCFRTWPGTPVRCVRTWPGTHGVMLQDLARDPRCVVSGPGP